MSAASQFGIAPSRARIRKAVREPSASRAVTPAAKKTQDGTAARDHPGPLPRDVRGVAQQLVAVRLAEIAAESLRALRDCLEHLCLLLLLVAAQLLRCLP